jgi:hypothetical protein
LAGYYDKLCYTTLIFVNKNMGNIETELYNGEIKLIFEPYRHKYQINGKSVSSVTTILSVINKPALINWAATTAVDCVVEQISPGVSYDEIQLMTIFEKAKKAHWQKKVDAGNIGTFVHNWVEDYINGKHPQLPNNENLKKAVQKFLDWQKEHKVEFLMSEQQIYSRKFNYTGTLDFICKIDDKLYIGDLKTSSGIYPEMLIQTAAYRYARTEEYPEEKYTGQVIVKVGKEDGNLQVALVNDDKWYSKMFTTFIAALKLKEGLDLIEQFRSEKL